MSEEIKATKRAFHEDIFADDADKWSWPGSVQNTKPSGSGVLYDTHTSEVKSESSSSLNSGEGFVFRGDSNSLKRSFRKRGSSCSSEGNQDDVSSSPHPSVGLRHERLLPSMYDDDARSGSPSSVFEKKDLAFRSSFKKSIDSSPAHSLEKSPTAAGSRTKRLPSDRDQSMDKQRFDSPKRKDSSDRSRRLSSDRKARSSRSGSRSREKKYRRKSKSRSRSRSRDRRGRSPMERRRSRSRDRHPDRRRRHSRSRTSPSRDSHRRSRSRSYDRHRRRGHYRSSSRDRRRRRRYSRSRSHSRDRSRGGTMTPQMALQQTMAAMNAKAQALTGVALPKYYNPAAVNPLKYAEQVQKRKLLWQTKEKVEVLCALNFFAYGCYQRKIGNDLNIRISQTSVSNSIRDVSYAISKNLLSKYVKFPDDESSQIAIKEEFYDYCGLGGVLGAVDCTHVSIIAPPNDGFHNEKNYVNRKGWHSLNVQLVCDMKMLIANVVARFPGCSHDAYIWNCSTLKRSLNHGNIIHGEGWLLGDSGYPQEEHLHIPFTNSALQRQGSSAEEYNLKHSRGRCVIERCNGTLKNRFRCLLKHRTLHYMPETAARIINSCVVLHNMCVEENLEWEEVDLEEEDQLFDQ